jgi:hypothetical protein
MECGGLSPNYRDDEQLVFIGVERFKTHFLSAFELFRCVGPRQKRALLTQ